MDKRLLGAVILLLLLGFPFPIQAQNAISSGSISGHVTDASGAAIAGAKVTCTNVSTGVQLTAETNIAGMYTFPALTVGTYTLSVSRSGFKTTEVNNVLVQVGQETAENVSLQVGSLSESVTVTATAPLLRTTESSVSTVVNQHLIEELPLSGRRYTDFVLLTPNVITDGQFGLVSVNGQQGGADSGYANGNGSNSFTLDGANATSNYFGDARGRTRVPYVFGEQSIQEFQVADNPYNAAYGGAGTGFVNTVTKSGTDAFHGDAFYYNRNSGTGADDAVDHANKIKTPLNVLQQFGADLGGPIASHKIWFYFDYEQQRQLEPISVVNTNFSAVTQTSFTNVFANAVLPPPNAHFPSPGPFGAAPLPTDPNYQAYLQEVSNTLHLIHSNLGERQRRRDDLSFFPKLDWQLGSNDHLTLVYNYNRFNSPGGTFTFNPVPFESDEALSNNFVRDHHATIHHVHIFANNLLNDLHVSFLRDQQINTPSGLVDPNFPQVGLLASGSFMGFGNQNFGRTDTKEFQWEIGEQINWIKGRHNLKFGFDFNRTHVTDFFPGGFQGNYFFLNPTDLALGEYLTFSQNTGNPLFRFTFPYYGFYVQDKFQVRHNLTLDLGVREDFQVYPQPTQNPGFPPTGQFPNQYQRVSPRLGFAYQPFGKTVVRGGFGIFYQVFNGINYEGSVISNGLASEQSSAFVFNSSAFSGAVPGNQLKPTFPGLLSTTGGQFAASSNLTIVDPGFKTPSVLEASLEIQRELFANTTLSVGSVWSHGVHLIASSAFDRNLKPPTGTTTYIVCPAGSGADPGHPVSTAVCTGPTFTRPNLDNGLLTEGRATPNFAQINALISPGLNQYNSFYVQILRRVSSGLSFMTAYTLSKNMQGNGVDFFNQFDLRGTHAPSLLDQRQRVSFAAVYSPNSSHLGNDVARILLSNWTLSTVIGLNSGRPYAGLLNSACVGTDFTTCSSASTLNDSAFNESTGNTAAGINGAGPSPGIGLNRFYGPWIDEVDLGISRGFHLTERHALTFRVQAFNLFNHPNFFVQTGRGINQTQYDPIGPTCGDSASTNQQCFLVPDPGFKTLQSISELNGPRVFQFALSWKF